MQQLNDDYYSQDAFDATTIRDKLANLNDEDEKIFTQYAETFTSCNSSGCVGDSSSTWLPLFGNTWIFFESKHSM
jgi:hypothetical protein